MTRLAPGTDYTKDFNRGVRQQIRQSQTKDDFHVVEDWDVADFMSFFEASDAQNEGPPVRSRLESAWRHGVLKIRALRCSDRVLCAHAILEAGSTAVFLHSYGLRKAADLSEEDRLQVGRANRVLCHSNLIYFGERGHTEFDWGGYRGVPGFGPDEFKIRFGGKVIDIVDVDSVVLPTADTVRF